MYKDNKYNYPNIDNYDSSIVGDSINPISMIPPGTKTGKGWFGGAGKGLSGGLKGLWNKQSGVQLGGIGKKVPYITGAMEGIKALQGLSENSKNASNYDDMLNDINAAAFGNPLVNSYLTSSQRNLLHKAKMGRLDGNDGAFGSAMDGVVQGLPSAAMSALGGFAMGGIPGAIVGGVGSLANSGIKGYGQGQNQNIGQLQALYQALEDADAQVNSMKRPNFTGMGIQQRYLDQYR